MLKLILIFFVMLNLVSCNTKTKLLNTSKSFNYKVNNASYASNYLTANYSIIKGDAYTTSRILDGNFSPELLEIKFLAITSIPSPTLYFL